MQKKKKTYVQESRMDLVWAASLKLAGRMTCYGKKGAEDFFYYEMLKNKILFYFKKSINEVKTQVTYRVGQNKKANFEMPPFRQILIFLLKTS